MLRLLLLFIGVPIIELALLIEIGRYIGTLPTLALIVATGLIGAALARRQGLQVLAKIRAEIDQGRLPAGSLLDGVMILVAAAVLMTPGVLTDALGFFCLVPATRRWLKKTLRDRLESGIREGRIRVVVDVAGVGSRHSEPKAGKAFLEIPKAEDGGGSEPQDV